jgi:hypothetical protein
LENIVRVTIRSQQILRNKTKLVNNVDTLPLSVFKKKNEFAFYYSLCYISYIYLFCRLQTPYTCLCCGRYPYTLPIADWLPGNSGGHQYSTDSSRPSGSFPYRSLIWKIYTIISMKLNNFKYFKQETKSFFTYIVCSYQTKQVLKVSW